MTVMMIMVMTRIPSQLMGGERTEQIIAILGIE